jgi:hypothetical protein
MYECAPYSWDRRTGKALDVRTMEAPTTISGRTGSPPELDFLVLDLFY